MRFESIEEVEWETEGYYLKNIEKFKDLWTRIELKREYIEK